MEILKLEQIKKLQNYDTPTVANAIEMFNVRSRIEGFMNSNIKCLLPARKPMVGYAGTAKMSALKPLSEEKEGIIYEYYRHIKDTFSPTISVIEDIDPSPVGSFWGEVHASIHKTLGCIGTITNGGVRDLEDVKKIDFGYLASSVLVSHGYDHIEEYDCPVEVGGLTIETGDLLHADIHGVVKIPHKIAPDLVKACEQVVKAEEIIIKPCQKRFKDGMKVEKIKKLREKMIEERSSLDF
ncbi:MAG: RraA family protein [bacterium]